MVSHKTFGMHHNVGDCVVDDEVGGATFKLCPVPRSKDISNYSFTVLAQLVAESDFLAEQTLLQSIGVLQEIYCPHVFAGNVHKLSEHHVIHNFVLEQQASFGESERGADGKQKCDSSARGMRVQAVGAT